MTSNQKLHKKIIHIKMLEFQQATATKKQKTNIKHKTLLLFFFTSHYLNHTHIRYHHRRHYNQLQTKKKHVKINKRLKTKSTNRLN